MYKDPNHFTIFARKRSDGKKYYYYYCYDAAGKRIKRTTGATSKAKALDIIAKRIADGTLVRTEGQATAQARNSRISSEAFFDRFFRGDTCPICSESMLRGKPYPERRIKSNRSSIDKYIKPFFAGKAIADITVADIKGWQQYIIRDKKMKHATCNNFLILLSQMLQVAVEEEIIASNTARRVKPLANDSVRFESFTPEEIKQLLDANWRNPLMLTAVKLAATTGMRLGELRALRFGALNDGMIQISNSMTPENIEKSTKSGKTRYCPILPELQAEIVAMRIERGADDSTYIFSYANGGKPLSATFFSRELTIKLEELGIEHRSMHSFRHFFNSMMAGNVSGDILRAVIGHQSEDMTDRYMHLEVADLSAIREIQKKIYG